MKISMFIDLGAALLLAVSAQAQGAKQGAAVPPTTQPAPEPPPVYFRNDTGDPALRAQYLQPPAAPAGGVYVYEQKPLPQAPALISPQEAGDIVERFRTNYARLGRPRFLIYVNRELVDEQTGAKLSGRSEIVENTTQHSSNTTGTNGATHAQSGSSKSVVKNNYHIQPKSAYSLADRQTVRDVERLMGRPLRQAGAVLADQTVATQLIGDQPMQNLAAGVAGQQAAKDREALGKIADVAVEV